MKKKSDNLLENVTKEERERGRALAEEGAEREEEADSPLSREPHMGLHPKTPEIMT